MEHFLLQFICISLSSPSERDLSVTKNFLHATIKKQKPNKEKKLKTPQVCPGFLYFFFIFLTFSKAWKLSF